MSIVFHAGLWPLRDFKIEKDISLSCLDLPSLDEPEASPNWEKIVTCEKTNSIFTSWNKTSQLGMYLLRFLCYWDIIFEKSTNDNVQWRRTRWCHWCHGTTCFLVSKSKKVSKSLEIKVSLFKVAPVVSTFVGRHCILGMFICNCIARFKKLV